MIELTLGEIADIVGGRLAGGAQASTLVTGSVEFDSRAVSKGGLFLALPGAKADGHQFAAAAASQGAVAVLAAHEVDAPAIVVPVRDIVDSNAEIYAHDTHGYGAAVVEALSALAREVVHRCVRDNSLTVVGVTGSAGKTSTKDLISTVLSTAGETVAPPGSFNNEVGLPYTALRCTADTDFLITEMSARGIGHIKHLTTITPPTIGAVLNVGSAHLGEFGSQENIAQAKGELIEALPPAEDGGVAVLNADDPFVLAMAQRTRAKVVTVSTGKTKADYWASDISLDKVARPSFILHTATGKWPVSLQVSGGHQVSNALVAAAVAIEAGLEPEKVVQALGSHTALSANRMDVQQRSDGLLIINDSYNANPDSMKAGIAALAYTASSRADGVSWAVLGKMAELGDNALQAHQNVGKQLAKYNIGRLVTVGDSAECLALADSAIEHGVRTDIVAGIDSAIELLRREARSNDVVLVKASNVDQFWKIAEMLLKPESHGFGLNVEGR